MPQEYWFGMLTGIGLGMLVMHGTDKLGDWLAWRDMQQHIANALRDRPSALPDERDADVRTLDAMDVYLDALDRKQRAHAAQKTSH